MRDNNSDNNRDKGENRKPRPLPESYQRRMTKIEENQKKNIVSCTQFFMELNARRQAEKLEKSKIEQTQQRNPNNIRVATNSLFKNEVKNPSISLRVQIQSQSHEKTLSGLYYRNDKVQITTQNSDRISKQKEIIPAQKSHQQPTTSYTHSGPLNTKINTSNTHSGPFATNPFGPNPFGSNPLPTNPLATNLFATNLLATNLLATNSLDTNPQATNPFGKNPVSAGTLGTGRLSINPFNTNNHPVPKDKKDQERCPQHKLPQQSNPQEHPPALNIFSEGLFSENKNPNKQRAVLIFNNNSELLKSSQSKLNPSSVNLNVICQAPIQVLFNNNNSTVEKVKPTWNIFQNRPIQQQDKVQTKEQTKKQQNTRQDIYIPEKMQIQQNMPLNVKPNLFSNPAKLDAKETPNLFSTPAKLDAKETPNLFSTPAKFNLRQQNQTSRLNLPFNASTLKAPTSSSSSLFQPSNTNFIKPGGFLQVNMPTISEQVFSNQSMTQRNQIESRTNVLGSINQQPKISLQRQSNIFQLPTQNSEKKEELDQKTIVPVGIRSGTAPWNQGANVSTHDKNMLNSVNQFPTQQVMLPQTNQASKEANYSGKIFDNTQNQQIQIAQKRDLPSMNPPNTFITNKQPQKAANIFAQLNNNKKTFNPFDNNTIIKPNNMSKNTEQTQSQPATIFSKNIQGNNIFNNPKFEGVNVFQAQNGFFKVGQKSGANLFTAKDDQSDDEDLSSEGNEVENEKDTENGVGTTKTVLELDENENLKADPSLDRKDGQIKYKYVQSQVLLKVQAPIFKFVTVDKRLDNVRLILQRYSQSQSIFLAVRTSSGMPLYRIQFYPMSQVQYMKEKGDTVSQISVNLKKVHITEVNNSKELNEFQIRIKLKDKDSAKEFIRECQKAINLAIQKMTQNQKMPPCTF